MIHVEHVTKRYKTRHGAVTVLDDVNLTIKPGQKIGILGRNGAGKSTIVRLIGGSEQPDTGRVRREMTVSWPLAFGGAFQGALTGLDNLKFICRVYGTSAEDKIDYVQNFSELGRYLREPVKSYSSGMRARLAFAISMVVEFDCFMIDEVIAVGDSRFHEKCRVELFEKRKDRALILVSHDPSFIRAHCDSAAVLVGGKLHSFVNVDDAFGFYEQQTVQ